MPTMSPHLRKALKKHTQRWWKARLDPLMSKLVRQKNFCEKCGRRGTSFDWSHVIGRKNLTLRWDILNALCLCFQCHRFFWHEEPLDAHNWFKDKYPERYEYLLKAKNMTLNRTEQDYIELREAIQNKNIKKLYIPLDKLQLS